MLCYFNISEVRPYETSPLSARLLKFDSFPYNLSFGASWQLELAFSLRLLLKPEVDIYPVPADIPERKLPEPTDVESLQF